MEQEILRDPRLLVAINGRLLTFSEALPHLVSDSVFGRSLLQVCGFERERFIQQWDDNHGVLCDDWPV